MKASVCHTSWIVIVPGAALAVLYAVFVFLPGEKANARVRHELAAAEEFVEQVEAFGSAMDATQREFDKTQQYIQAWKQSAPSEDGLSALFGEINRLATQSGTTTTRFEPEPAIRYDAVCRVPIAMACVGSFGQVCEFLRGLESLDETIWVEDLQMEETGKESENVQCEMTLAVFADNPDDSDQVDPRD